jgi:hypothetical protein
MGSTTSASPFSSIRRSLAAVVIACGLVVAADAEAPRQRHVFRGACYCRAGADLHCSSNLTEVECRTRCTEELCDDWFWLERRACWNWGYGG